MKKSYITQGFSSKKIEYYACWEDIQVIQDALKINSNDVVLSISSAGCNILNFLLYNPKKIYAVDFNLYQNYLLELKIEAIKNLDYDEFLRFLGIKSSTKPEDLYQLIRKNLNKETQIFWDSNVNAIKEGLIYYGEQNIKIIGNLLRFLKGKKVIEGFFKCKTFNEQADYFYKNIYGVPWRLYFKVIYNKNLTKLSVCSRMLSEFHHRTKKTSGIIKYIQKLSYPEKHLKQIENAFINNPIKNNYFASLLLLGRYFNENCYPPYLKKESYSILKDRVNRIQILTSSLNKILNELPNDSITKYNLSNIFDWYDDLYFKQHLEEIIRVGKNGARLFYSATRNDREIPKDISSIQPEKELAIQLLEKDRTMLYSNFVVGKISK